MYSTCPIHWSILFFIFLSTNFLHNKKSTSRFVPPLLCIRLALSIDQNYFFDSRIFLHTKKSTPRIVSPLLYSRCALVIDHFLFKSTNFFAREEKQIKNCLTSFVYSMSFSLINFFVNPWIFLRIKNSTSRIASPLLCIRPAHRLFVALFVGESFVRPLLIFFLNERVTNESSTSMSKSWTCMC